MSSVMAAYGPDATGRMVVFGLGPTGDEALEDAEGMCDTDADYASLRVAEITEEQRRVIVGGNCSWPVVAS